MTRLLPPLLLLSLVPAPAGAQYDSRLSNLEKRAADVFNVKTCGARGNGVADDYAAILRCVAKVNAAGGGTLVFPHGTYKIARYRIDAPAADANGVTDFIFTGVRGLVIEGNGSKLDMNGAYIRTDDGGGISYRNTVGIRFVSSSDVTVRDLEIDGNNQDTTKVAAAEGEDYGLYVIGSERLMFDRVWSHHYPTDGINIRDSGGTSPVTISKHITILNSRFDFNGRQGMSIVGARWVTVINSHFRDTGRSSYGYHSPAAGVDIEPTTWPGALTASGGGTKDADDYSGDITFVGCHFENNQGSEMVATYARRFSIPGPLLYPVTFLGCHFVGVVGGGSRVMPEGAIVTFRDSKFTNVQLMPAFGQPETQNERTLIENCDFSNADPAQSVIRWIKVDGELIVRDSRFRLTSTTTVSANRWYAQATGTARFEFSGNYVFTDAREHTGTGRVTYNVGTTNGELSDNTWETDLVTAGAFWQIGASQVRRDRWKSPGHYSATTSVSTATHYSGGAGVLSTAAAAADTATFTATPGALGTAATLADLNTLRAAVNTLKANLRTSNALTP